MARERHILVTTVAALLLLLRAQPLRADVGLWFVKSPEPFASPPNDTVDFECSLNVPAEQIRWRHGGHFLNHTHPGIEGSIGNHSSRTTSSLAVKMVDQNQAGDYQCVAWFGASALASVPARLSLADLKPFAERLKRTYQAFVGNTVVIHLPFPESSPPVEVECHHKNKGKFIVPATGVLLLTNVTYRDSGSYVCSSYNYVTWQRIPNSHNVTLDVRPASGRTSLKILEPLKDSYVVQTGWNITLECSAVGNPTPNVTWTKYGGVLPVNRAHMVPGGLALRNIRRGDEGTYICKLNNGVGPTLTHVAMVHLHELPEIVKEPPNMITVEEGGEVKLECQVKGQPHPEVTWMLNGESLDNDTHVKAHGGKLHIIQVEKKHAGIFQCFATNAVGSVYGSSLLQVSPKQVTANPNGELPAEQDPTFQELPLGNVDAFLTPSPTVGNRNSGGKKDHTRKGNGKTKDGRKGSKGNAVMIPPSRPNITRLTDTSVMVRWLVPPNDGLPIQFFKVQYHEMGGRTNTRRRGNKASRWMTNNDDIPPHIRSYEVDGLETEHIYRFRIAAVYSNNDNKLGLNSGRFHLHRGPSNNKNPLSAPTLTNVEAVSPTALQLHWHYVPSLSQPVEGFYVYYRTTSSAGVYIKATVEGEKTRSFIITHLQQDTAYDIKLQSFTVGAASDFSAILTHKTLGVPTEHPPALVPEVINVNASSSESSHGQLYIVIGAVVGGLGLLLSFVLVIFLCNRRKNNRQPPQDSEEQSGKFSDPTLQLQAVTAFSKSHINGRLPQNGFVHNSKINITSNPMVDSEEDKNPSAIEMSFLSSQNNNCSAESEPGGSGTSSDSSWEEDLTNTRLPTGSVAPQSKSSKEGSPARRMKPVKSSVTTSSDTTSWHGPTQKNVGENYV